MRGVFIFTISAFFLLGIFLIVEPGIGGSNKFQMAPVSKSDIKNKQLKNYTFLKGMRNDSYFPFFLVNKCENILIELCINIERKQPKKLQELYQITHAATRKFNSLENEFFENGSEIETLAAETIGMDFYYIAKSYSFAHADVEMLIAPRNW